MSKDELRKIIAKGLQLLDLGIEDAVKEKIVEFSSGFPHYTHLLAKHSAKECIQKEEKTIRETHYKQALNRALKIRIKAFETRIKRPP